MQAEGPTVQGELERALATIVQSPVRVIGAGRTDAGVHATGQVISFRLPGALDGRELGRGVNALLPEDIAVSRIEPAGEDFHARFSARGRTYEYRIRTAAVRDPIEGHRELHVPQPLDAAAMRDAARRLVGRHRFGGFAAGEDGERTVRRAELLAEEGRLRLVIEADAFLRGMVRGIVGTLLWVGRGKITPARFGEILASGDRSLSGPSADPRGLCLVAVEYGESGYAGHGTGEGEDLHDEGE